MGKVKARATAIERQKQARIQWEHDKKNLLLKDACKWQDITIMKSILADLKAKLPSNPSDDVLKWMRWADGILSEKDILRDGLEAYVKTYEYDSNKSKSVEGQ